MRFVRKLVNSRGYGYISIPKPIMDCLGDCTAVEIRFYEKNKTLIINTLEKT